MDSPGFSPTTAVQHFSRRLDRYRVSMLLGLGALLAVGAVEGSLLATISVGAVTGGAAALLLSFEAEGKAVGRFLQRMFWAAFGLRILFTAGIYLSLRAWGLQSPLAVQRSMPFEPAFMFVDEFTYWRWSTSYMEAWQASSILQAQLPAHAYATWAHILGFIRFLGAALGGDTIFNAKLASCTAGALVVPYTYLTAKRLFGHRVADLAAALAFFLPEFWYLGTSLMRDTLIALLILVVVYQILYAWQVHCAWWRLMLVLAIGLVLIPHVRHHLHYVVLPIVVLCITVAHPTTWPARVIQWLTIAAVLLGAVALLLGAVLAVAAPDAYWIGVPPLEALFSRAQAFAQRWASYYGIQIQDRLAKASTDSLGAVLLRFPWPLRVPLSVVRLFLMPLPPWGSLLNRNAHPLAAAFDLTAGLVWYTLMPLLPIGLWRSFRHGLRATVWLWGPLAILALALALPGANDLRYRLMLMPFALVLVSDGWYARHEAPPAMFRLARLVPAGVIGFYLILKYLWPRGLGPALLGVAALLLVLLALDVALGRMRRRAVENTRQSAAERECQHDPYS